jgi:hypothetical protein
MHIWHENQRLQFYLDQNRFITKEDAKYLPHIFQRKVIVEPSELREICVWIQNNKQLFTKDGFKELTHTFDEDSTHVPQIIHDIRKRIMQNEHLHDCVQDKHMKDRITILSKGAHVPLQFVPNWHTGMVHVRYILMVQRGTGLDGAIIANRCVYDMCPGAILKACNGQYKCGTLDVSGSEQVITISFGFHAPIESLYMANTPHVEQSLVYAVQDQESMNARLKHVYKWHEDQRVYDLVMRDCVDGHKVENLSNPIICCDRDADEILQLMDTILLSAGRVDIKQHNTYMFRNIPFDMLPRSVCDIHERVCKQDVIHGRTSLREVNMCIIQCGGCYIHRAENGTEMIINIPIMHGEESSLVCFYRDKYVSVSQYSYLNCKHCDDFGCVPNNGNAPIVLLQLVYE